jgi:hypothetical protein
MKRILITISLITILGSALPAPAARAQDLLFNPTSGQQAVCRGGSDFSVFLSALISYDDFVEYWKDIFVRYNANICQYQDIDTLLKQITRVRKQIREAFYVCGDTGSLTETYYRLEAELFFLRKYVTVIGGEIVEPKDLIDDLQSYFVLDKGYFTQEKMLQLFNEFVAKYQPRMETYKKCTDPSWEALVTKWNEFKENAGGFGPAIKQAGASISKRWERMANTPIKQGAKFFGDFLDMNINGLPPLEGLQQIGDELERMYPGGYTFSDLQAAQSLAQQSYDESTMLATYEAQYRALYGETSGKYTEQMIYRLTVLDDIINATGPYQNQTFQCARRILDKQC